MIINTKNIMIYFLFIFFLITTCNSNDVKDEIIKINKSSDNLGENSMDDKDILVILEIGPRKSRKEIIIKFRNNSQERICLPYWLLLEEGMEENIFNIKNEKGEKAEYIGIQIKRKPPTKEDMRCLDPMTEISKNILLDEYYKFPPSSKEIKIQYKAYYTNNRNELKKLLSNELIYSMD